MVCGRWHGRRPLERRPEPGVRRPGGGLRVGVELVDALLAGRMAEARRLLADHGRDPVVATVVVDGLGAAATVDLLRPAVVEWARPGTDADDQRAVVLGVAGLLAGAERSRTTDLTVGDLADAARRGSVPLRARPPLRRRGPIPELLRCGMPSGRWSRPLNAALRAEPGLGVGPWMIPAAGGCLSTPGSWSWRPPPGTTRPQSRPSVPSISTTCSPARWAISTAGWHWPASSWPRPRR